MVSTCIFLVFFFLLAASCEDLVIGYPVTDVARKWAYLGRKSISFDFCVLQLSK